MTKVKDRLQGKDWQLLKDKLVAIHFFKNTNGHIKGIYKDPNTNFKYIHWLNDKEIKENLLTNNQ